MPIFRGTNNIKKIFRGNNEIVKVFRGTNLIFTSGLPQYEELADINVTTATTQIDFDNLNITKDDELRLVYTFRNTSIQPNFRLNYNNVTTNYTYQRIIPIASSIFALRENIADFSLTRTTRPTTSGFADIKISNNDRFVVQSHSILGQGQSASIKENLFYNLINTNNVSNITKLSIISNLTNGIGVGSRLQLYKAVK